MAAGSKPPTSKKLGMLRVPPFFGVSFTTDKVVDVAAVLVSVIFVVGGVVVPGDVQATKRVTNKVR